MLLSKRLLSILMILALYTPAYAEGEDTPYSVFAEGHYIGEAEMESNEGSFGITGFTTGFSIPFLDFSYTQDRYDWSNASRLPLGTNGDDPWETMHTLALSSGYSDQINDTWGWFVHGGISSAFESDINDSFGAMATGGLTYAVTDTISISAGAGIAFHSLENAIFPVISIDYNGRGADGLGTFGSLGLDGVQAGYAFSKEFRLVGDVTRTGDLYRLADDSKVEREGFVEFSGWKGGVRAEYDITSEFSLSGGMDYHFARTMKVYDSDGDERKKLDIDGAPGFSLGVSYSF